MFLNHNAKPTTIRETAFSLPLGTNRDRASELTDDRVLEPMTSISEDRILKEEETTAVGALRMLRSQNDATLHNNLRNVEDQTTATTVPRALIRRVMELETENSAKENELLGLREELRTALESVNSLRGQLRREQRTTPSSSTSTVTDLNLTHFDDRSSTPVPTNVSISTNAPVLDQQHTSAATTVLQDRNGTARRGSLSGAWGERFAELKNYKRLHGHCNISRETRGLGIWAKNQRREYRLRMKGKSFAMTPERIEALNSIGFVWDRLSTKWSQKFDELVGYKEVHGNCLVPRCYKENAELGRWINTQRVEYKKKQDGKRSALTRERIEKLEAVGFQWKDPRIGKGGQTDGGPTPVVPC